MQMNGMIRLGLVLLSLVSVTVHGQTSGPAPDVGAGKRRAAVCFACHNVDGVAKIPGVPNLAGQHADYLEEALHAYRDGKTRQNPTMNAMTAPLSDRDIANIAAYFSLLNDGGKASALAYVAGGGGGRVTTIPAATSVAKAETVATTPTRSGGSVYGSVCYACHATGAAGAPKVGDKAAWLPRLREGDATLQQHALQGYNAMPARGGCAACSNAEIRAAIGYMTEKSR